MADTGKQSPLGINVMGSLMQNEGFCINPTAESYMGVSKLTDPVPNSSNDYSPGLLVNDTCLKWLTQAIHDGYQRGAPKQSNPNVPVGSYTISASTYNNLITIGKDSIPALGNSPPNTWKTEDPSGVWKNQHTDFYPDSVAGAPANSGYPFYNYSTSPTNAYINEGQSASWYPYLCTNDANEIIPNRAITQWGWIRCIALQAWNEFNYNGESATDQPKYKNFCQSFNTYYGLMGTFNKAIFSIAHSMNFLQGAYSNQDDLMSADVLGVCLASRDFGQDLINLGKAIDYSLIKKFGLPSALLETLYKNNALTPALVLALLTNGLSQSEITGIANGTLTATKNQEQKIYASTLIITGVDLEEILLTINCMTKTIKLLSDLLDVKKMFPLSYSALTVPVYNANPGPTNSKTYYPLYINGDVNSALKSNAMQKIVGTITPTAIAPESSRGISEVSTVTEVEISSKAISAIDITDDQENQLKDLVKKVNVDINTYIPQDKM